MLDANSDLVPLKMLDFNEELEQRVFEIADQVAKECALSFIYSSFHVWEYFRDYAADDDVPQHVADNIWKDLGPYSHCVGHAYKVTARLREALAQEEGLAKYATMPKCLQRCRMAEPLLKARFTM